MLTKVKVSNFKCIESLEIQLNPLMAFVGPNDSGKSTFLEAIHIGATGKMEPPTNFASFPDFALFPSLLGNDAAKSDDNFPTITLWQDTDGEIKSWDRQIRFGKSAAADDTWTAPELYQTARQIFEVVGAGPVIPALLYSPRPTQLKQPSYAPPRRFNTPLENPYALPSMLAYLVGESRQIFLEIEQRLHNWVPTVRSIILKRCPVEGVSGDCLWFELTSGERVPSIMMSDGTILLLGYLTILLTPPRHKLLLIDGPEEGIHPHALHKLLSFLREMQQENSRLQILLTSHSPDLLSLLEPHEIALTYRQEGGYTQAARLDQHPNISEWLKGVTPGELWLWDGEQEIINRIIAAREQVNE